MAAPWTGIEFVQPIGQILYFRDDNVEAQNVPNIDLTLAEFASFAIGETDRFFTLVVDGNRPHNNGQMPQPASTQFAALMVQMKDVSGDYKLEISIGSFVLEATFDATTERVLLERNAFVVEWTTWLAIVVLVRAWLDTLRLIFEIPA